MLVAMHANPYTQEVYFGNRESVIQQVIFKRIYSQINAEDYRDKRVVIKGCGDRLISENVYVAITNILMPVVKSLMYGEPCSTVPIYKK
jgi:hypothetical protein